MSELKPLVATSVDELRKFISLDDADAQSLKLGAQSKRVLSMMIEQPMPAAMESISELANRFSVNASTLSRLARRLGYSGFADLQSVFKDEVAKSGSGFYSKQAHRIQHDVSPEISLLSQASQNAAANIDAMLQGVDSDSFAKVARLLADSNRVRVYGMRQFYSVGFFVAYGLGMIRSDVAMLESGRQGIADTLAALEAGDTLVVISCFPYTQSVLSTAELAAKQGVNVIALTDTASSPLARYAKYSFFVPNNSLFFSNSMTAFFVLIEALLTDVARLLGDDAILALKRREALIDQLKPFS